MNLFLITFIFSMLLTIVLVPIFCAIALRTGTSLDVPDERKIHKQPIPRIGGFAMTLGIVAPVLLWGELGEFVKAVFLGSAIIFILGLVDDVKGLRFRIKFAVQFLAAFLVIFFGELQITDLGTIIPGISPLNPIFSIPFTAFVIVGVTNAINLADGLDGLAGGICMLSFIAIAYFAHSLGNGDIALLSLSVSGAIFGFLRFNTHPSSIFMGDTGSQLLGFLAVTLSLGVTQNNGPVSPYVPLLIIGLPILDTLVVMTERISAGKSPFLPDKNHLHHKLIKLGFHHSEAVINLYLIQVVFVTSAYILRFFTDWFVLFIYLFFSALLVSLLIMVEKSGFQVQRVHLLDNIIKRQLRILRDTNLVIKVSFRIVLLSVPLLLFFSCFIPAHLPDVMGAISLGFLFLLLGLALIKNDLFGSLVRIALFIVIPFIVYFSEVDPVTWISVTVLKGYTIWGAFTILFIGLTMKFTRRSDRLQATPLHILMLLIALIIPNLPGTSGHDLHLGAIAIKIMFFFFGFEVLLAEVRNKMNWLGLVTGSCFAVLAGKVYFGF